MGRPAIYTIRIIASTQAGEEHIAALHLGAREITLFRQRFVGALLGLTEENELRSWLGYPDNLTDLRLRRLPTGNQRREGVYDCAFVRRHSGTLRKIY